MTQPHIPPKPEPRHRRGRESPPFFTPGDERIKVERRTALSEAYKIGSKGPGLCVICSAPLTPDRRKYCSVACRNNAYISANPHTRHIMLQILPRHCEVCGVEVTPSGPRGGCKWWRSTAKIHHVLPISEGGKNERENLIALCHKCHVKIHALRCFYQGWIDSKIDYPKQRAQDRQLGLALEGGK